MLAQVGPKSDPSWPVLAHVGPKWAPSWPMMAHLNPSWPQIGPPQLLRPDLSMVFTKALPLTSGFTRWSRRLCLLGLAFPWCSRRLCLLAWLFHGVHEGSASWPCLFHGVHEGSAAGVWLFQGFHGCSEEQVHPLAFVPSRCFVLVLLAGRLVMKCPAKGFI